MPRSSTSGAPDGDEEEGGGRVSRRSDLPSSADRDAARVRDAPDDVARPPCPRSVKAVMTAAPTRPPAMAYSTVVNPSSSRMKAMILFIFVPRLDM